MRIDNDLRIKATEAPASHTLETQEPAEGTAEGATGGPARSSPSVDGAGSPLPPLELGLHLEALVLELKDGRLLLQIGSSLVEAADPGGISVGQQLHLRVEQLQPQVVLQITEAPTIEAEATQFLREHLSAHEDTGKLLEHLQTLLKAQLETPGAAASGITPKKLYDAIGLMLGDRAPVSAERLQTLLQDGGLYYEAKLAGAIVNDGKTMGDIADRDLKGLLLSAVEESKSTVFGKEILQTIHTQLSNLEAEQAANLLAQLSGGGLQLQIPFFNGAGFTTVTLSVEPDGKGPEHKSEQQGGYNLLFLLDLENFGQTRIEAHLEEHRALVIFYVDRDSSVALTNEGLAGFREVLLGMGYQEVLLAARPLIEIPVDKRQRFDALAAGAPGSTQLLDMKV